MIVFLNFAPIEFMGGAEKWMLETAKKIHEKEKTHLVSADESLSNIYAKLILKRTFEKRQKNITHPYSKITIKSIIPFTREWRKMKKIFTDARIIYAKYEFQEMLILMYFSGFKGLRKTIAGLHSPIMYYSPVTFIERLHNTIYLSSISRFILKRVKKIHSLNRRDAQVLQKLFSVNNIMIIPNGIKPPDLTRLTYERKSETLGVIFVGELSERKGVDVLVEVAKQLPSFISLTIVGDGPMAEQVKQVSQSRPNIMYKGYLSKEKLHSLYRKHDVLLLPSRFETFSLVVLEAISFGLKVITSKEVPIDLPKYIQNKANSHMPNSYLRKILSMVREKKVHPVDRNKIIQFFNENFSEQVVLPMIFNKLLRS